MKTKLLSVFLVLALLLTSVLCVLPISAEEDYDAQAKAKGYVCRVGTAEEAVANDYAGYYTSPVQAAFAARTGGKTVTLIADVTLSENHIYTDAANQSLVFDGNNHLLTIDSTNKQFQAKGGTLTDKNLKIKVDNSSEGVVTSNGGTLTFENCSFEITSNYTRGDGFISSNTSGEASLTFKNCNFAIDATSKWAKSGKGFFWQYGNNNPVLNFEGTTLDLSKTNLPLFTTSKVVLSIKDGSDIKIAKTIPSANVTIADSAVEATADGVNLFAYNSYGVAINIKATGAKLTAKAKAFEFSGCKNTVNVTIDGASVVTSGDRLMNITNNQKDVNVTVGGKTQLKWLGTTASEGIYACGTAGLVLNIWDEASYQVPDGKTAISTNHGSNHLNPFVFNLLGKASILVPNGTLLNAGKANTTYNRADTSSFTAKTEKTGNNLTTNYIATPKMVVGASIRIVENSNGLRFTSTLHNNAKFKTYGTLIVKKAELGDTEFTMAALAAANVKFANIVATEAGTVAGDTQTTYNAALTNLPEDQFVTDFAARAYVIYTINGEDYIVYSDYKPVDNTRNINDVAEAAKNDTKSERTDKYCHEVKEGVWSPYTKAQYELLEGFIKKNS